MDGAPVGISAGVGSGAALVGWDHDPSIIQRLALGGMAAGFLHGNHRMLCPNLTLTPLWRGTSTGLNSSPCCQSYAVLQFIEAAGRIKSCARPCLKTIQMPG